MGIGKNCSTSEATPLGLGRVAASDVKQCLGLTLAELLKAIESGDYGFLEIERGDKFGNRRDCPEPGFYRVAKFGSGSVVASRFEHPTAGKAAHKGRALGHHYGGGCGRRDLNKFDHHTKAGLSYNPVLTPMPTSVAPSSSSIFSGKGSH